MPTFLVIACYILGANALECLLRPRLRWRALFSPVAFLCRTTIALAAWLFFFGIFYDIWFAAIAALLSLAVIVAGSNAKYKLLNEPLVFLDLQLAGQALRHPKLYYAEVIRTPWQVAAVLVGIAVAAAVILPWTSTGFLSFSSPQEILWRAMCIAAPFALWWVARITPINRRLANLLAKPASNPDPAQNTADWGLFAPICAQYCRWVAEGKEPKRLENPFGSFPSVTNRLHTAPHIIAVQCESFIDPSRLSPPSDMLATFAEAKRQSTLSGRLRVPAGGAYTMRSEFAFLTGVRETELGMDRFNPYARAERMGPPSLAIHLRKAGYRTDFIHPHDLRFFRRDRVMPALGFDTLHGEEAFAAPDRFGPHVSDVAIATLTADLLSASREPRFVFAVTMENHGPWPEKRIPSECTPVGIYLRHLRNSLLMIQRLQHLELKRPYVFCVYGDHTPILSGHFEPDERTLTDYLIHASEVRTTGQRQPLEVHQLAGHILHTAHQLGFEFEPSLGQPLAA